MTPPASDLMKSILAIMPRGLTARTLADVLEQSGFERDEAASVIRRGLDTGTVALGENLNIVTGPCA